MAKKTFMEKVEEMVMGVAEPKKKVTKSPANKKKTTKTAAVKPSTKAKSAKKSSGKKTKKTKRR